MAFLTRILSPLRHALSRMRTPSVGIPTSLGVLASLTAILMAVSRLGRDKSVSSPPEEPATLPRFDRSMRLAHWLLLAGFLLLTYSGIAMIWPPIALGSMNVTFWLHRVGAVFFVAGPAYVFLFYPKRLLAYSAQFVSWTASDVIWLILFPFYLLFPRKVKLPRTTLKLNPGQRLIGAGIVVTAALLIVSGGFRFLEGFVPYELVSRARLVHRLTVPIFLVFVAAHSYLGLGLHAAFVGVTRTMLGDGKVTRELARLHWPGWYEEARRGDERPGVPSAFGLWGVCFLLGTAIAILSVFIWVSGADGERLVTEMPHGRFEVDVGGRAIEVRVTPSSSRSGVLVEYVDQEANVSGAAIPPSVRKEALIRSLVNEIGPLDRLRTEEATTASR